MHRILHILRQSWNRAKGSIAFYPAIIAVLFLVLSFLMLELDFSETGKSLKASYKWLRLRDASTARSIISTIAAGLLSFTVFSFSMVMILLTQAASQLSNRILSNLIGRPFQQAVLGCYIGTILYALFLLTAIRDIDSGIYIPALSIYLLILLTIFDIFLFIYFLHFVTQSVRYETVIASLLSKTEASMRAARAGEPVLPPPPRPEDAGRSMILSSPTCGYYQGFNRRALISAAKAAGVHLRMLHPVGTFLLKGAPLAEVCGARTLTEKEEAALNEALDFFSDGSPDAHYTYGYRQLTEVALRALSPGINDPSTAVQALHALGRLLAQRLRHAVGTHFADDKGCTRIVTMEPDVEALVHNYLRPVWDYGKKDRYIQVAMHGLITQLMVIANTTQETAPFRRLLAEVEAAKSELEKGI